MESYRIISEYYGTDTTERSKVPLMHHIDEGIKILEGLQASAVVKEAYCLHPLLQSDESFNENKSMNFEGVPHEALLLAMEYRRVANSYLSRGNKDDFVGFTCIEVKQMLIADKVQNYKDFMLHHYGTHARSEDLKKYFHNWFRLLAIDYERWKKLLI